MAIHEQGPVTGADIEIDDAPENESKADKFTRLGGKRVTAVLEKIRLIGNLANGSIYEWTPEQVDRMERAINDEIAVTFHRLRKQKIDKKRTFSF